MINLEIFGEADAMRTVAGRLDGHDGVSRVRVVEATRPGHSVVLAAVRPRAVDPLLDSLHELGVPDSDITLMHVEVVGRAATARAQTSLVWEEVLGAAWVNARPIARYLAFMFVAGVIGCYGVVDRNAILIVGAMAIAPDLLPITAVGVGVVARRPGLAGRALLTIAVGMAIAILAAAAFAFAQDQLDLIPSGFSFDSASAALGGLTTVDDETLVVALVAGVAGMLALETRASGAVGVAISVTTIPAAAYLGVAAGMGEIGKAAGTLGVLSMNIAMMVVGAIVTLVVQGRLRDRASARRRGPALTR
jgi:uncharacterized hydrophobic protein (TIGR00271 family)